MLIIIRFLEEYTNWAGVSWISQKSRTSAQACENL